MSNGFLSTTGGLCPGQSSRGVAVSAVDFVWAHRADDTDDTGPRSFLGSHLKCLHCNGHFTLMDPADWEQWWPVLPVGSDGGSHCMPHDRLFHALAIVPITCIRAKGGVRTLAVMPPAHPDRLFRAMAIVPITCIRAKGGGPHSGGHAPCTPR